MSRVKRKQGTEPEIPDPVRPAYEAVVALTDRFCLRHRDREYADLCRRLAGALAGVEPSPLTSGKPASWAAGVVRVIAWVNFLGDPSQPGHLRLTDIDQGIGVSEATGNAKSMAIRRLLGIRRMDPEWTVPSRMGGNLLAWLIEVDGLPIDARSAPREVQEQAYRKGLIPYIPGEKGEAE